MKKAGGKGSTAKHVGTGKHGRTAKHHPTRQKAGPTATGGGQTTVAKHPTHAKARALAAGGEWASCVAEALGASLRLAGWPVTDEDVLALHVAAGGSQDRGVPILDGLLACGATFAAVEADFPPGTVLGLELPGPHAVTLAEDGCWLSWGEHHDPADFPDAVIEEAWVVTWR